VLNVAAHRGNEAHFSAANSAQMTEAMTAEVWLQLSLFVGI